MMNKRILPLLLALVLVLALAVPASAAEKSKDFGKPPKELANTSQKEWDVLRLTNIQRAKAGLPLLVTFEAVERAAGIRAGEIVSVFSHTRPDGSSPNTVFKGLGYSYNAFGENIAWGQTTAKQVIKDWMGSPGHKENILREAFRHMGVGYKNKNWVQIFAADKSSDAISIDYNEELGYFTLKLKSGITAYAPYDPASSPTVDGKVTFNYPGLELQTGIKTLDDGWYNLRTMNNYLNLDALGKAELRNNSATGNQAYYVENMGDNQITLRMADGRYLGVDATIKDGVQLKVVDKPYPWNIYSENNADIFSLRPPTNIEMVVNASGEKDDDSTNIILWTHSNIDAPTHAEFRFIPTNEPEASITPYIPAPNSFTIKKTSATKAKCTWKAVTDADGYEVYYATSEKGSFKKVGSTLEELEFTKTSLKAGKSYYFKIRAFKTVDGEKVYGEFTEVKKIKM